MHHRIFIAAALGCFSLLSIVAAAPAAAASITIDYPQAGDTVVSEVLSTSPLIEAVTLAGTLSQALANPDPIVAYLDCRFDSCEAYFGEDPLAGGGCFHAGVSQGSEWTFQITRDQIERPGFDFYGKHTVEIRWMHRRAEGVTWQSDSVMFTLVKELTSAPPSPLAAAPGKSGTDAPDIERTVSKLSNGSPSAPSVLSATSTAQQLELPVAHVTFTALVTVIFLLIVGYPGMLLGNTLGDKKNYERLFGRPVRIAKKIRGRFVQRGQAQTARVKTPSWITVAVGMLSATVIAGFVDPGFGANLGSLRLLASVGIAFVLENLLGWWLIRRLLKKTDPELKIVILVWGDARACQAGTCDADRARLCLRTRDSWLGRLQPAYGCRGPRILADLRFGNAQWAHGERYCVAFGCAASAGRLRWC